jgi:hypothetical protein
MVPASVISFDGPTGQNRYSIAQCLSQDAQLNLSR